MYPDQNPSVRGDSWMKGQHVNRICTAKLVPVACVGSILCSFELMLLMQFIPLFLFQTFPKEMFSLSSSLKRNLTT